MTCQEINDYLDAYLAAELSLEERQRFDSHLSICKSCVAYVATYRAATAMGRTALRAETELDVPEGLIAAVLAARGGAH